LNLILNDPSNSTFHHTNSNFLLSDPLIHDVGLLKRELWNHNGSVLDVVRWVLCFRELERFVADAEIVWTSYRGDVFGSFWHFVLWGFFFFLDIGWRVLLDLAFVCILLGVIDLFVLILFLTLFDVIFS
jgi:hypothetical protein